MKLNFKKIAGALAITATALALPEMVSAEELVKVVGQGNKVIATYPAKSVAFLEFADGNLANVSSDKIVFNLSDHVNFTMIKVEGGVEYTLTSDGEKLQTGPWANGIATKNMEDYWIGQFEVTQAVWKEVMGITDAAWNKSALRDRQTLDNDAAPIAAISWTNANNFITKINEKLELLKASDPILAAAIGDRQFRLPTEWEWEYAAAGGKNYVENNYYYCGTSEKTTEALETVAVNSIAPNQATSVAVVGSKLPNSLGLYDMSGNVWEWCSGLGLAGFDEAGFLKAEGGDYLTANRPLRGGGFGSTSEPYYHVKKRHSADIAGSILNTYGFRLVL